MKDVNDEIKQIKEDKCKDIRYKEWDETFRRIEQQLQNKLPKGFE